MKFSIEGRMRNMRLPDGKTALLFSMYEAVSNGLHAIGERFDAAEAIEQGRISIEVSLSANKKMVEAISIKDNGIGLNHEHLQSFETCDTVQNSDIGGRGVGRLVGLKASNAVSVRSVFETSQSRYERVNFLFETEREDSLVGLERIPAEALEIGTAIELTHPKPEHNEKLSMAFLARNLCHHFFPYFIAGSMPRLTITIGKRTVDLGQYLDSRMDVEGEEDIDLSLSGLGTLHITHVYVDPKIARGLSNSILLTAQGRVVESIEIEKKFALKELDNKLAYVCVVRGHFLDDKVDQERTSFKARDTDMDLIKDAALSAAERFLAVHIEKIQVTQKRIVVDLLEEHPQLAISVPNVQAYVEKLSPSMSDEDIGKTLFTLLYRHEKRVRAQVQSLTAVEGDDSMQSQPKPDVVQALVHKLGDDAKRRLAEYTVKRHQIIQVARAMLRHTDDESRRYELEKTVHNLVYPMGRMLSAKDYDDHNLWLIDDLLSFYHFFASDKAMTTFGVDGVRQESDLIFFNPFGFRRAGTTDPVVIIEFKRPGDESLTSDPVDQVLGYIEKLHLKTIRDPEGEVISDITANTPFECIIICDLTASVRKKFERSLAQNPTPDGLGYYGFSPKHRASIRVISYAKLFRDAEMRNRSFFDKLGLLPQEVTNAITSLMTAA